MRCCARAGTAAHGTLCVSCVGPDLRVRKWYCLVFGGAGKYIKNEFLY